RPLQHRLQVGSFGGRWAPDTREPTFSHPRTRSSLHCLLNAFVSVTPAKRPCGSSAWPRTMTACTRASPPTSWAAPRPRRASECWVSRRHRRGRARSAFATGRFSVVKRCDHRATKRPVAVKQVNKKLMRRDLVTQEVNLLHRLQHPNIVNLVDTYETPSSYVLVLEMADQGRLLDYIVSWGNLTEEKVACYLRDLLDALHYLHNSRIAHLDVKPENLLVVHGPSGQPLVKLTDLGDAVQLGGAPYVHPLLGSPEFASPELVLGEPVSLTSDVWSVGVVAYVMLSGASPFLDESAEETCLNICRQDFSFPKDYFRGISREACDFVRLLLRSEPAGRPPSGNVELILLCKKKKKTHTHKQNPQNKARMTQSPFGGHGCPRLLLLAASHSHFVGKLTPTGRKNVNRKE
uniref:Protein kinase domain-containing protein n=1 Tax=Hippocampus comes TaxID=109280 RepID=A0A3Q2Y9F0_HIPCM